MSEMDMSKADAHDALYISRLIRPKLSGLGPPIQGAVLMDLTSMLFAGIHPDLREEALAEWIKGLHAMIPISEREIFGERGWHK